MILHAIQDLIRREETALRYWRHLNDQVLPGDPAAEFDAEFRGLAKELGLEPYVPGDVEPTLDDALAPGAEQ